MLTLSERAALVIRSLVQMLHVSDHMVYEEGKPAISANAVATELEAQTRTPADTGNRIASLAGKYGNFTAGDLLVLSASDETGTLDAFAADVRSMAASLRRQNER